MYRYLFAGVCIAVFTGWVAALAQQPTGSGFATKSILTTPSSGNPASVQSAGSASTPEEEYQRTLNLYCVTCHNERLQTADLILEGIDLSNVGKNVPIWEKVVRKLRAGQMPPAGAPRPDAETGDSIATYLELELDQIAATEPNPGSRPAHRLNRLEYANAIRDLLGVEIDSEQLLPAEDSSYGFDNIAEVLSVSPLLAEKYVAAADKISRLAIGTPSIRPATEMYTVPEKLTQHDRMSEDLPFGSRGGISVRHNFPTDGEYVINIRLTRNLDNYIRGLGEPHQVDIRLDGARLKLITVGGEHKGKSGPIYTFVNKDYKGDPEQEKYEFGADLGLEVRFEVSAGPHLVGVSFLKEYVEPETVLMPRNLQSLFADRGDYKGGDPLIAAVGISGPYNPKGLGETPSRRRVFSCYPSAIHEEEPCARNILSSLARRAYRRPVTEQDINPLLELFQNGRTDGEFEAGIRTALQGILVSAEFLFRIEQDPNNGVRATAHPVSDLDLASRLSFFLWSSIPDGELLDLAVGGKLKDPTVLKQQVRRMLKDQRSEVLMKNFAGQWLLLRNMLRVSPDPRAFPYFDDSLREAIHRETELFVANIADEDRTVLDLLSADYTFLNERLAQHYGISGVYGSHFRRVSLKDKNRKGLLGKAGILTVTSYANRTSPTLRGKWVLEKLLGTPPPPPPPNVPSLKEETTDKEGKALTMRQRLDLHRTNTACASCHARMDPLGLALDNFDALGKWRDDEGGTPIDPSGVLPDGAKFSGPAELTTILEKRGDQVAQTITEKLLIYALGRGLDEYDAPTVREILRKGNPSNYRWSALVLGIVESKPFQMRRSEQP